jgi:outer membrane autotransporter protein
MIADMTHPGQESRTRRGSVRIALLAGTALAGFALAPPAHGQDVWVGGTSTDWFDAANWPAAVPDAADDIFISITDAPFMPVIDAGAAFGKNVFLGFAIGAPTGTLTIQNGGTLNNDFGYIGADAGYDYSALVTGAGSEWVSTSAIVVGAAGTGMLTISDGGTVSSGFGIIGDQVAGSGAVMVDGPGSEWNSSDDLFVGYRGAGSLNVSNGAAVNNIAGFIGFEPGSTGTVTVDGMGSSWTNTSEIYVGEEGNGSLTISDGGAVNNTFARIGNMATGSGTVTVTGPGSSWTNSMFIVVGEDGSGSLSVLNGGAVSSTNMSIGDEPTGNGRVDVDGPGSTLSTTAGNLIVGQDGEGILVISSGGFVDVASGSGSVFIAQNAGSEGIVIIGAGVFGGGPATGAGSILADAVIFGAGTGSLIFNHTDSAYTFSPDITDMGFILHASGTTSYTGDGSGFTGTAEISGGVFNVNNTLGGMVNVTGGALGGTGLLTGALTIGAGGTIAPGNSIGTLNVTDITIAAGSTYEVEVDSAGNSDLINATGTATINGSTVQVLPFPDFALGTTYTIVTAAGGVAGTYDMATGSLFITPTLTYDANNVFLSLAQTTAFTAVAMTPNQVAAAGGAQSLGGGTLFNAIALLGTADEANAAFDAVSGEVHASAGTALIGDSRFVREVANERIRSAFGEVTGKAMPVLAYGEDGRELAPADTHRFAVWGQGFGSWGRRQSDGNAAAMGRNIGGIFLGGDALVSDNVRLGLMGGYSHTNLNINGRASAAAADTYTLGAYGGGQWNAFSLNGGLAHSWHSLSTSRSVNFTGFSDSLSASYTARTFQAYAEAAYSIEHGNARISPFANLAYVNLHTDGFTEAGGAAALTASGQNQAAFFTTLGLRGETNVKLGKMNANLRGMLGWRHAFGNTPTSTHGFVSGGSAFTVAGVPVARDALVLEAGVDVNLSDSAKIGLSYSGQFGSGFSDHGAKASLSGSF